MPFSAQLTAWPPHLFLVLISAVCLGFAWLGVALRRRCIPDRHLAQSSEAVGVIFSNIAILFTVLLAFIVIGEWEEYNKSLAGAEQEPACLVGVAHLAQAFPKDSPQALRLRQALITYCEDVAGKEYPAMARMQRSGETEQASAALWNAARDLEPRTSRETNAQQVILHQLGEMQKARTSRLLTANRGLPGILWLVIALFAALTMGFSLFLPTEDGRTQRFTVGGFALAVALVLFAIVELNYPFIGEVSVSGEGFQSVVDVLNS
jgi:hypothetical protein